MNGEIVLLLALGAVATWRVSHMLIRENGPFSLFRKGREALGVVYYDDGALAAARYEITTCIWCLSMWIGGFFGALIYFVPGLALWIMLPYVFSAMAVILDKHFGMES